MAFRLSNELFVVRPVYQTLPVTNAIAVTLGDVVRLTDGRFNLCATNEVPFGVSMTPGTVTGNAAGTEVIQVVLAFGCAFEVPQGAVLSDANSQPGDTADINATSDGITTSTNADFKIWEVDREKNLVYGFFSMGNTAVFPF
jgi:hypothetical protein